MESQMFSMAMRGGEVEDHSHGTKRKADDSSLVDADRFVKRFNLLDLGSPASAHAISNLYIPISRSQPLDRPSEQSPLPAHVTINNDGSMQVDDTPNRVYVHDLNAELDDDTFEEERLIFIPDIEKKLSRIPQQILTGRDNKDYSNQQLVLYRPPELVADDVNLDPVQRAMREASQRASQRLAEEARRLDMMRKYNQDYDHELSVETAHGYGAGYGANGGLAGDVDLDAMEMD